VISPNLLGGTPGPNFLGRGVTEQEVWTARTWLMLADFETLNDTELHAVFVERVGYDKADEVKAAMKRIAENLLDALGDLKLSEKSMLRLLRAVSSIAVDNYFPEARRGG
jgi:hypothetical protein